MKTLDELLAHCRFLITKNLTAYVIPEAIDFAEVVINLLGAGQPCGFEEPEIKPGEIHVDLPDQWLSPEEMRAICAVYLRAADKAEAKTHREGDRDANDT